MLVFSLLGLVHTLFERMTRGKEEVKRIDELQMRTRPKKISYCQLETATNNFEET